MKDWLFCKREGQYFVTVRSCVDNNYGGGTKGRSDRRRCANGNTCSEVFGCSTELEDECTGDQLGTARLTEARHSYVRLLWRMEGAICYVRCGAPVCCGAKNVSVRPSGLLHLQTSPRRYRLVTTRLVGFGVDGLHPLLDDGARTSQVETERSRSPFRTTLTCGADWSTRSGSRGHSNGERRVCNVCQLW